MVTLKQATEGFKQLIEAWRKAGMNFGKADKFESRAAYFERMERERAYYEALKTLAKRIRLAGLIIGLATWALLWYAYDALLANLIVAAIFANNLGRTKV